MKQLIFCKNGKEADWIDPIINIEITDTKIVVDNGYAKYTYEKKENGMWFEVRNPQKEFDFYKIVELEEAK